MFIYFTILFNFNHAIFFIKHIILFTLINFIFLCFWNSFSWLKIYHILATFVVMCTKFSIIKLYYIIIKLWLILILLFYTQLINLMLIISINGIIFGIKLSSLILFYFIIRSIFPNYRFDHIMIIHWKFIMPLTLILFLFYSWYFYIAN